jgi:hypothetical protein
MATGRWFSSSDAMKMGGKGARGKIRTCSQGFEKIFKTDERARNNILFEPYQTKKGISVTVTMPASISV